jgi:hypothetical protein
MNEQENQQENQQEVVKKIYLGNGQERARQGGDKFITGSLCLDEIEKIPTEYIQTGKNGKRYFKFILSPYRQGANEYGHTHSFAVDTYKPDMDKQAFNK